MRLLLFGFKLAMVSALIASGLSAQNEQKQVEAKSESQANRFLLRGVQFEGLHLYTEEQLFQVAAPQIGERVSIDDLKNYAKEWSNYYHEQGHRYAQVKLPAQEIRNGVVTFAVVEAKYGKILTHGELGDSATDWLKQFDRGDYINATQLEHQLKTLSDLPGVEMQSVIKPGENFAEGDLEVTVTPGKRYEVSLVADNYGNRYGGATSRRGASQSK